LTYARVHDQTVAEDYFKAMNSVEKRLDLLGKEAEKQKEVNDSERIELLALTDQLLSSRLSLELCLEVATKMRTVLNRSSFFHDAATPEGRFHEHAPPHSCLVA
jgi:hypothetical protein